MGRLLSCAALFCLFQTFFKLNNLFPGKIKTLVKSEIFVLSLFFTFRPNESR